MRRHTHGPETLCNEPPAPWTGIRRLLIAGVLLAAMMTVLQVPGCAPDPRRTALGGLTETVMTDGELVPVTLRFLDQGEPTPVRAYFQYRNSAYVLGPRVGYYFPVFWDRFYQDKYFVMDPDLPLLDLAIGMDHHYYFLTGEMTVLLPPGPYTITAYKGLEYRPAQVQFTVTGETMTQDINLERWIDMQAEGWYGGDAHIHLARDGRENDVYLAMQEADGLHVGHYLQLQRLWQGAVQTTWGAAGEARTELAILRSGEESRSWFGHTLLLGIDKLILPVGMGGISTDPDRVVKLTPDIFQEARAAGGLVGYAHGDGLNRTSAAAIDLAHGDIDLLEVFQFNRMRKDFWYDALSAGYRIPPAAGTDFPVNVGRRQPWPHLISPVSAERMYVQVGNDFTFDNWMAGLQAGRVMLTNGPMVDFRVNGMPPGSEVQVADYATKLTVSGRIAHWRPMQEARLIVNGRVFHILRNRDRETRWDFTVEIALRESAWLALHVVSDSTGGTADDAILLQAHTAPVYVVKGAQPIGVRVAFERLIQRVETSREFYASRAWDYADPRMRERLLERADVALATYQEALAGLPAMAAPDYRE